MAPTIPPPTNPDLGRLPGRTPLPPAPPPNTQGPPFYPPPGLPFQYGHAGVMGSQYHAAAMGMNAPQHYYGAPPYPLFGHHGNAGPWGYGHYPPSTFPDPLPHPGDLQLRRAHVQARIMAARAEEGVSQASRS